MEEKTKVAFVCVHNSCRSQIAEALAKANYAHVFDAYSAGTETKPQINQDAVRLMKRQYQIDMEETQYSKLIDELPAVDIVITMGCNVDCPYLPCRHREDWGLDDPSGQSDQVFLATMHQIEEKLQQLATILENSNRSLSNKQGAIV
ncbi:arsenate reductase ArsC [Streptococcus suis]|uniref:arsenate reductase/protein-tyrosine-phosphatase family protein n=1 Tax=Streptococcus suis TaxID=1307 RepID=UPI0014792199|nr:arsenate reductase ArsC [Streptococcus suis]